MKLVFIASLERSGSTILDISLAKYPNVISLGEVWRVIKPHGAGLDSVLSRECTCGREGSQCPFWGSVLTAIAKLDENATLIDRYKVFSEVARAHYSNDVVLVDSSKSIQALGALTMIESLDVHVIFSVRDVRGWMNSVRKAGKRKREIPWGKIFEPDFKMFWLSYIRHNILRLLPFWLANEWILRNIRLSRCVTKTGFRRLDISYEELVLSTESTYRKIEKALNITQSTENRNKRQKTEYQVHILRGNRTAFDSVVNGKLNYDPEWMTLWKYSAMFTVMPWIANFNKKYVYGYLSKKRDH